jgi:hypothetical protein
MTDRIDVDGRTESVAFTDSTHAALQAELRLSGTSWSYYLNDTSTWKSSAQSLVKGSHARGQEAHMRLLCLQAF